MPMQEMNIFQAIRTTTMHETDILVRIIEIDEKPASEIQEYRVTFLNATNLKTKKEDSRSVLSPQVIPKPHLSLWRGV